MWSSTSGATDGPDRPAHVREVVDGRDDATSPCCFTSPQSTMCTGRKRLTQFGFSRSQVFSALRIAFPPSLGMLPPRNRAISSSGRCVAESPMRCGASGATRVEPLEREREVRAALRARHGVDLVDDHRAQRAEHRAPAHAREQDVQRLRRRDQDVRRLAQHLRARARRRVARAHRDADLGEPLARRLEPLLQLRRAAVSRLRWMSLLSALSGEM